MSVKLKKILFCCAFVLGCAKGLKEHYDLERQKKNIENSDSVLLECINPRRDFGCDSPIIRLYLYAKFDNKIVFCNNWSEVYPECSDEKINKMISLFEGENK